MSLLVLVFLCCSAEVQYEKVTSHEPSIKTEKHKIAPRPFTIQGQIRGLLNGTVSLAKLDLTTNTQETIDSVHLKEGLFSFSGSISTPYLHSIIIQPPETAEEGPKQAIHFFLGPQDISIDADISQIESAQITGSAEDAIFRSYAEDDYFDLEKGLKIMQKHPDSVVAAFTAYYQFQLFNYELEEMTEIMDSFTPAVQQSTYFEHLLPLVEAIKRVSIGAVAPEFAIPDTQGNLVKRSDIKGKILLLDFWASWCAPCRATNPELLHLYEKYHGKGFEIVGISVDDSKGRWIRAIKEDQLPWIQLSNLSGWDEMTDIYGVKAVPQNFLLSSDGTILDKNIAPETLDALLSERL